MGADLDFEKMSISTADAAAMLEISERHLRRVAAEHGIRPADGRWPLRPIIDLAIHRAIDGSPEATGERLRHVTARLHEVEAALAAERRKRNR
jgi:hypothetical protein